MGDILLDSTRGELEILEFTVNGVYFGINVAKVQEIIKAPEITSTPLASKGVLGCILVRNDIYSVIDLNIILYHKETDMESQPYIILCNFNNQKNSFVVENVLGIRRVAWSEMKKPSNILNSEDVSSIVGIITLDDQIISVLDFEKIVTDINPANGLKIDELKAVDDSKRKERQKHTILVADDSRMINKMLTDTITKEGYNVVSVEDGKQALDTYLANPSNYSLLVTDVEMPVMDGLECSRLLKEKYPDFPIIVFSSLVNEALTRKIENLHLEDTITKPEIGQLVERIDALVL